MTLAENLDMRVVAEGIETEGHFEAVKRLGCEILQGYGIGRPMDVASFREWYAAYETNVSSDHQRRA